MAVNQQTLAGNWREIRGKLKEKWGQLTNDDLRFEGTMDQIIGRIEQRTGESKEAIREFLDEIGEEGSDLLDAAREKLDDAAEYVADTARQGYDAFRGGYSEAEKMVKNRPMQSFALAFGAGIVAGLGVSLLLRRPSASSLSAQGRETADRLGRHLYDAIVAYVPDAIKKRT